MFISTAVSDSRKVFQGVMFVALRGERTDGHAFIAIARQAGALVALVEEFIVDDLPQIKVSSCREALAELARFQLQRYPVKIVGVTGSMGKTSCKDLIASVLATHYKVLKSQGNMNTEVTLPITLFELDETYDVAVLEMGMVAKGEIQELCQIAKPDIAMISNIMEVHLERLGSIEAIAETKGEIFRALDCQGVAMVNADDLHVKEQALKSGAAVYTYGFSEGAYVTAQEIVDKGRLGSDFSLYIDGKRREIQLPLIGIHSVHNSLPAALAGYLLGLSLDEIAIGLASVKLSEQRLSVHDLAGQRLLIDDSYNANPRSMAAALDFVSSIREDRPLYLVLGDMLELGSISENAHRELGNRVAALAPAMLITRGDAAQTIAKTVSEKELDQTVVYQAENNQEALRYLVQNLPEKAIVLVKGSRGIQMEQIVEGLEAMF